MTYRLPTEPLNEGVLLLVPVSTLSSNHPTSMVKGEEPTGGGACCDIELMDEDEVGILALSAPPFLAARLGDAGLSRGRADRGLPNVGRLTLGPAS